MTKPVRSSSYFATIFLRVVAGLTVETVSDISRWWKNINGLFFALTISSTSGLSQATIILSKPQLIAFSILNSNKLEVPSFKDQQSNSKSKFDLQIITPKLGAAIVFACFHLFRQNTKNVSGLFRVLFFFESIRKKSLNHQVCLQFFV